jgi:hypothetical protein
MTVAATTINRLAVALLACGVMPAGLCRAEEPAAADLVHSYVDKQCDAANQSWMIENRHTYLSLQVTIQWHPVGGKQSEETVVLSPQERRPVGCAPAVQIVSVQLMEF